MGQKVEFFQPVPVALFVALPLAVGSVLSVAVAPAVGKRLLAPAQAYLQSDSGLQTLVMQQVQFSLQELKYWLLEDLAFFQQSEHTQIMRKYIVLK